MLQIFRTENELSLDLISSKEIEAAEVDIVKMTLDQCWEVSKKKAQMRLTEGDKEEIERKKRKKRLAQLRWQCEISAYVSGALVVPLCLVTAFVIRSSLCDCFHEFSVNN
jgi:cytochrome c biogenesis factor